MGTLKHTPESPQLSSVIVGAWDFSRDIPLVKVSAASPNVLHGTIVDMPARDTKGYNWTGRTMSWQEAPQQYREIHFHEDDVYNAN